MSSTSRKHRSRYLKQLPSVSRWGGWMVPRCGELYRSFYKADHCSQGLLWIAKLLSADPYPAESEVSRDLFATIVSNMTRFRIHVHKMATQRDCRGSHADLRRDTHREKISRLAPSRQFVHSFLIRGVDPRRAGAGGACARVAQWRARITKTKM